MEKLITTVSLGSTGSGMVRCGIIRKRVCPGPRARCTVPVLSLVIAIGLSPVMTFEREDAGEGPEDLLGTSQGFFFSNKTFTIHCGDFYLLYFTAREVERSPQGVNRLSNQEVTQKNKLKMKRTMQGV